MARIPDHIKDQITEYANDNLLQIIGEHLTLHKKSADNYGACCPFHGEKTASFNVSLGRKTWRCFGQCQDGGDAIKFVRMYLNLSFPAALEYLARRGGIEIPQGESKEEKERKAMLQAMSKAATFYAEQLTANTNGPKAYVESRLSEELVKKFNIGFAPTSGHALVDFMTKEKISMDIAELAGLVRSEEKGDRKVYKDYFWNRIMFPIRNSMGQTIGFAGRTMTKDGKMKYVNTPETPLYKKSSTLFGLDLTLEAIKKSGEAIVVEGYLDFIQMYGAGITNVVATCGTAFTKDHAAYLKRYCRKLNLMFDGDAAGVKALQKGIVLSVREEMVAVTYQLPEGQDPDDYFKAGGKLEDIKTQSGFDFLKDTGVEMSATMKQLHQRERLERGVIYMAQHIPAVAQVLSKRGNLDELFSQDALVQIEESIKKLTSSK